MFFHSLIFYCSGCSIAVEHTPRYREAMGSNPAGCWAFFLFSFFLWITQSISGVSLIRSLTEVHHNWLSWKMNAQLCSLRRSKLNRQGLSKKIINSCFCSVRGKGSTEIRRRSLAQTFEVLDHLEDDVDQATLEGFEALQWRRFE